MNADQATEAAMRAGGGLILIFLGVCLLASAPVALGRSIITRK